MDDREFVADLANSAEAVASGIDRQQCQLSAVVRDSKLAGEVVPQVVAYSDREKNFILQGVKNNTDGKSAFFLFPFAKAFQLISQQQKKSQYHKEY